MTVYRTQFVKMDNLRVPYVAGTSTSKVISFVVGTTALEAGDVLEFYGVPADSTLTDLQVEGGAGAADIAILSGDFAGDDQARASVHDIVAAHAFPGAFNASLAQLLSVPYGRIVHGIGLVATTPIAAGSTFRARIEYSN